MGGKKKRQDNILFQFILTDVQFKANLYLRPFRPRLFPSKIDCTFLRTKLFTEGLPDPGPVTGTEG